MHCRHCDTNVGVQQAKHHLFDIASCSRSLRVFGDMNKASSMPSSPSPAALVLLLDDMSCSLELVS